MAFVFTRCSAPFYVQFELTQRCNNRCFFCYNAIGQVDGNELTTEEAKRILREMADAGVFRVNFNGGEPLAREDFLDICRYACDLGLELHMNTNATMITDTVAKQLSTLMRSVCTSMLSSDPQRHDAMSGRLGAFKETLLGMDHLHEHGVGIEVNVCTTMDNYRELYSIAEVAAVHGCYAICSTRYILTHESNSHLVMTADATMELVGILARIKQEVKGIEDVSLPGPVPLCEVPPHMREALKRLNIPCQYGYGLCRISANGTVTPCTISPDVIGNLREVSFHQAWNAAAWRKYAQADHIPANCHICEEFSTCRGGCVVYDDCLMNNGMSPLTRKWTGKLP